MKRLLCYMVVGCGLAAALFPLTLEFRTQDHGSYSRLVFEADQDFKFEIRLAEKKIELSIPPKADFRNNGATFENSQLVERVLSEKRAGDTLLSVYLKDDAEVLRQFVLKNPFRVVFDLAKSAKPAATPAPTAEPLRVPPLQPEASALPKENPPPSAQKDNPPAPALLQQAPARGRPIETICIDAGHGGEDLGAVGKSKVQEKDITLRVARRLKKMVESKLGLRVILTRDKDSDVSLNNRASIANNQQAQLFVSIHVNSSFRKTAFGSETYFADLKATDEEAGELALKENQSAKDLGETIQNDELKMILWNMAQTEYIRESSRLAEYIQGELNDLGNTLNRGVKQALFRVLMRVAMPATLIEIAFVSNSEDEKKLQDDDYLERVATAIYSGIAKFIYYYNTNLK